MSEMTERQVRDWPTAISEIHKYAPEMPEQPDAWHIAYAPEQRPGRGHSLTATCVDDAYLAQIWMDVYGGPNVFVAELTRLHNSADESCECGPCKDNEGDDE